MPGPGSRLTSRLVIEREGGQHHGSMARSETNGGGIILPLADMACSIPLLLLVVAILARRTQPDAPALDGASAIARAIGSPFFL